MPTRCSRVASVALMIGVVATGCGGDKKDPAVPTAGPTTGEAFGGVQCTSVRPQTEPDLMAWDSGSRATLRSVKDQGVVVVHYEAEGCNVQLHVLPNCVARGAYQFSPYSANDTKVAHNANELFAELPIGASKLSGKLKGTHAIRTDFMMAGVESLKIGSTFRRNDLVGECSDATHVVSKIYVGGFALAAGESRELEASASIFVGTFSPKAGGSSDSAIEHLQHEGSAEACDESQKKGTPSPQCSVPLRIALMSLAASDASAPASPSPATPSSAPTVAKAGDAACADIESCSVQCDKGAAAACAWLGNTFENGLGTPKDAVRAIGAYKQACHLDDIHSCARLCVLYQTASGTPDVVASMRNAAVQMCRRSCQAGDQGACAEQRKLEGRFSLSARNRLSKGLRLNRLLMVVDRQVQYSRQDDSGALASVDEVPAFAGSVPVGDHTVEITFEAKRESGGPVLQKKSGHAITVRGGKTTQLTASFSDTEQGAQVEWIETVDGQTTSSIGN